MAGLFDELKKYIKDALPGGSLNPEVTRQGVLDAAALATAPVPVVGDVTGLASDAYRMYSNPEERTAANAGLAALGLLPFFPAGVIGKRFKTPERVTEVPGYGTAGEISDQFSSIDHKKLEEALKYFRGRDVTLGEILKHPSLYRDYPELAKYPVKPTGLFDFGLKGAYGDGTLLLSRTDFQNMDKLNQTHSTLLHEVQHAIQELDKMPRGGMTAEFIDKSVSKAAPKVDKARQTYINTLSNEAGVTTFDVALRSKQYLEKIKGNSDLERLDQMLQKANKLKSSLDSKQNQAYEKYRALAGEAQSRAVQKRFENPQEYAKDVLNSYDVPIDTLIFKDPFTPTIK